MQRTALRAAADACHFKPFAINCDQHCARYFQGQVQIDTRRAQELLVLPTSFLERLLRRNTVTGMHIERVLSLINHTDIPEKKRRFWPQQSLVVVSSNACVIDVIQYYTDDDANAVLHRASVYYPQTRMFMASPGDHASIEELQQRINDCYAPRTPDTYIAGRGLIRDLPPDEQARLLAEPPAGPD